MIRSVNQSRRGHQCQGTRHDVWTNTLNFNSVKLRERLAQSEKKKEVCLDKGYSLKLKKSDGHRQEQEKSRTGAVH